MVFSTQNANWGHLQDRIGICMCWFLRRGENRTTRRKTSQSKDENQQQTQPTYDAGTGSQTQATLVGGECSHHCTNSLLPNYNYIYLSITLSKGQ